MSIASFVNALPSSDSFSAQPRPYINHSVEFKQPFTRNERSRMMEQVGFNVFYFPSRMITGCDMLSDSGTTSMTNEQWAAMHMGDEAYGSNKGYFELLETIRFIFGKEFANDPTLGRPNVFLFHQGRPAENALFSAISTTGKNLIIPSNGHFDTTEANIQANGIEAINLFSPQLRADDPLYPFKGNIDLSRLKSVLEKNHKRIPVVYLTITNNTGGGQPVSLQNIRETSTLVRHYNIPLFIDACRFAENAWFIQSRENAYKATPIVEIIKEIFSYADGFTISFKKDGLVNMGGGLFLRNDGLLIRNFPHIPDSIMNHQIRTEGHPTYGGLAGRDIMALTVGLKTAITQEYLSYRIRQVEHFGMMMHDLKLPVITPIGGHAVYLDMNKFFEGTTKKPQDFGGIAFTALLLAGYGHRACELGNFAFGTYNPKSGEEHFPEVNFVRFAIPRLRYEQQDLDHVVYATKAIYDRRETIPNVEVTYGKELPLRHFKAHFKLNF